MRWPLTLALGLVALAFRDSVRENQALLWSSSNFNVRPGSTKDRACRPACYSPAVDSGPSSLAGWTPEQIDQGRRWVKAWKEAGDVMERLRRTELRQLDAHKALALLCGSADYHVAPRAPKPTSGLVEQQRWFMRAAR